VEPSTITDPIYSGLVDRYSCRNYFLTFIDIARFTGPRVEEKTSGSAYTAATDSIEKR
jgi:hypothetical protein